MASEVSCFSCQKILKFADKIGFREECPHCRADVHVCKNCDFYDPRVYNECRETEATRVQEKVRANYCEFFTPKATNAANGKNSKDALRAAAEALFKKP